MMKKGKNGKNTIKSMQWNFDLKVYEIDSSFFYAYSNHDLNSELIVRYSTEWNLLSELFIMIANYMVLCWTPDWIEDVQVFFARPKIISLVGREQLRRSEVQSYLT